MIVQTIKVNDCAPQTIVIGRRGTYDTLQIAFYLSYLVESYGNGVAVLAVKRSQDESAYPAVVTQENNTLTWTVSETDTYYVGAGEAQLMWYVDGGLAKTIIYPMVVMKDILMTSEEAPDAYQTWVDDLIAEGAETLQNAQDAAQSATEAKASEKSAAENAKKAEDAAGLLVDVSATATTLNSGQPATAKYNDGVFMFGIPKGDKLTYADLTKADKEDLVQGPIKDAQDDAVEAVGTAKTNAVDAVNQAGTTQKDAVNQAGTTNKNAVTQEGTTQVNAVREAGTTQVGRVTTEGNTQVNRVQTKGDEVIASIPSDYSDLADDVSDLTRQLNDETTGLDTKAPVIINTASGAIASFDDGADSMPIRKLVAQIEPVQDLHGYENPWPAGGMGNKWNEDWEVGTINVANGIESSTNNSIRSKSFSQCTPDTDYYVFCGAGSSQWFLGICWYDENKQFISGSYRNRKTATSPSNAAYFKITTNTSGDVYGNTYNQDIAINNPPTVTTYHPYSNECPISGHTGAEIEQTGVNLFEPLSDVAYKAESDVWFNGYNVTSLVAFLNTLPVGNYIVSFKFNVLETVSGATSWGILIRNSVTGYIDGRQTGQHNSGETLTFSRSITITTANKGQFANAYLYSGGGNAAKVYWYDFQLELGSTATTYEPYTGNQISVTFPSEAGTVYGGTLDVTSGKLVVDTFGNVINNLSGDGYAYTQSDDFYYGYLHVSFPSPAKNGGIFSYLRSLAPNVNNHDCAMIFTSRLIRINISQLERTAEAYRAYLAQNQLQIVYSIVPIEYQLTPQEIDTLLGTNNILSDTGDTEVTYPCDTRLYIDNKITQAIAAALNA